MLQASKGEHIYIYIGGQLFAFGGYRYPSLTQESLNYQLPAKML